MLLGQTMPDTTLLHSCRRRLISRRQTASEQWISHTEFLQSCAKPKKERASLRPTRIIFEIVRLGRKNGSSALKVSSSRRSSKPNNRATSFLAAAFGRASRRWSTLTKKISLLPRPHSLANLGSKAGNAWYVPIDAAGRPSSSLVCTRAWLACSAIGHGSAAIGAVTSEVVKQSARNPAYPSTQHTLTPPTPLLLTLTLRTHVGMFGKRGWMMNCQEATSIAVQRLSTFLRLLDRLVGEASKELKLRLPVRAEQPGR
jgi:hypothetical protein